MEQNKKYLGKRKIILIHLNDSKTPFGSMIDRHWHIGKGYIGHKGLSNILNDRDLRHASYITETPGMGKRDRENMKTIKTLLRNEHVVECG